MLDIINRSDIVVSNIDTKENYVDMLTKAFFMAKIEYYLDLVGNCCWISP